MEEINYSELFGIDDSGLTENDGAKEGEPAEPTESSRDNSDSMEEDSSGSDEASSDETSGDSTSANETAENQNIEDTVSESSDGSGDDKKTSKDDIKEQSTELRSGFAAARRRAESESKAKMDLALKKSKEENDKLIENILSVTGMKDPYTGEPIRTREAYEKYMQGRSDEEKNSFIKRSGITEEQFSRMVHELPEIKSLEQRAIDAEKKVEVIAKETLQKNIDAQIKKINAYEPQIKSLEDITKLDCYPALYEKVKRGYSIDDAYYIVNRESIEEKKTAAAKQSVLNAQASKEHLTKTQSKGSAQDLPPGEVIQAYRMFNPDASDADISRHWAKYNKK